MPPRNGYAYSIRSSQRRQWRPTGGGPAIRVDSTGRPRLRREIERVVLDREIDAIRACAQRDPAFLSTRDRPVEFAASHPLTHVPGCHVEMFAVSPDEVFSHPGQA